MSDPAPGITASPHDDNLRYFDVVMTGPEGSPFQGKCCDSWFLSLPRLRHTCLCLKRSPYWRARGRAAVADKRV